MSTNQNATTNPATTTIVFVAPTDGGNPAPTAAPNTPTKAQRLDIWKRQAKFMNRIRSTNRTLKGREGFLFATGGVEGGKLTLSIIGSNVQAVQAMKTELGETYKGWPTTYYSRI